MIKILTYNDDFKAQTIKFVLGILENEFGRKNIKRPDLYKIKNTYQIDNGNFWIAMDNDKIVGTIALLDCGKQRGYIKRMYVDKVHRGTGFAKKLLDVLLNFARIKKFKVIYLATIEDMLAAQKFYMKHDFAKINSLPKDFPKFGDTIFYKLELK